MAEEIIKKDLLAIFDEQMAEEKKAREKAIAKTEELNTISGFISSLNESADNLKNYSREWLEKLLKSYYQNKELSELLDRLEIPLLAIMMRMNGISIGLNEEELEILSSFQKDIKNIFERENRKFKEDVVGGVEAIEKRISDLNSLYEKINTGGIGENFVHKSEIDYILRLTAKEDANTDMQIEILGMLNRINLQIHKNKLGS